MENLAKVFGARPAAKFMEWYVVGRDGVSERRIGPKREKTAEAIGSNPDGAFYIGESIRLDIAPPFSGYFQLWNLGTSGKPKILLPSLRVNGMFSIPGEGEVRIGVKGPPTSEKGLFEIVIGIISKEPVEIDPEAIGAARSAVSTRGIGSVEEVKKFSLSDLPEEDWEWSILEIEVKS